MNTPFSVHMIVALEWLLSALIGFYSLMFFVFGFYGLIHLNFLRMFTSIGVAVLMGAVAAGSLIVGRGLREGRRWAWIASWCYGIFVMLCGWYSFHEGLHGNSPDAYFGLIVGPFLVVCALIGIVLLVLPQTRRHCDPTLN
jgi:hypothetical protein